VAGSTIWLVMMTLRSRSAVATPFVSKLRLGVGSDPGHLLGDVFRVPTLYWPMTTNCWVAGDLGRDCQGHRRIRGVMVIDFKKTEFPVRLDQTVLPPQPPAL